MTEMIEHRLEISQVDQTIYIWTNGRTISLDIQMATQIRDGLTAVLANPTTTISTIPREAGDRQQWQPRPEDL